MKKWIKLFLACTLIFVFCGCKPEKEYEEIPVTMDEVQGMLDDQQDFILLVERENCPFCEKLHDYIEESKREHNEITIYVLDTTSFKFKKENETSKTLISDTREGTMFLEAFPYFLYTPSLYIVSSGEAVSVGSGFDTVTKEISVWDVDSVVDFDRAMDKNIWSYLEEAETE